METRGFADPEDRGANVNSPGIGATKSCRLGRNRWLTLQRVIGENPGSHPTREPRSPNIFTRDREDKIRTARGQAPEGLRITTRSKNNLPANR
jgi:hypothetical protein